MRLQARFRCTSATESRTSDKPHFHRSILAARGVKSNKGNVIGADDTVKEKRNRSRRARGFPPSFPPRPGVKFLYLSEDGAEFVDSVAVHEVSGSTFTLTQARYVLSTRGHVIIYNCRPSVAFSDLVPNGIAARRRIAATMASKISPCFVSGTIVKGFGRGSRALGIPTGNSPSLPPTPLVPPDRRIEHVPILARDGKRRGARPSIDRDASHIEQQRSTSFLSPSVRKGDREEVLLSPLIPSSPRSNRDPRRARGVPLAGG